MTEPLPLVTCQQGLWVIENWSPDRPVNHIPVVLRLTGALDVDALVIAVRELGIRHEALHARFSLRERRLNHWLEPPAPVPVRRESLTVPPGHDPATVLRAVL